MMTGLPSNAFFDCTKVQLHTQPISTKNRKKSKKRSRTIEFVRAFQAYILPWVGDLDQRFSRITYTKVASVISPREKDFSTTILRVELPEEA